MESVYNALADQESKETYEAVIRYRINRDPQILSQVARPGKEQYFPSCLGGQRFLSTDEIFVDAGAYSGDTIQGFLEAVQRQYRFIHAFEPESGNYKKLLEHVGALPNIACRQLGIGSEKAEIKFSSTRKSSKADASGDQVVQIDTLDHLFERETVTFLKMDIEGMECAALQGAKNLIQTMHPKLAICTYHSNADMVWVPKLILELDPTYTLYFRHYSHALPETICYAV